MAEMIDGLLREELISFAANNILVLNKARILAVDEDLDDEDFRAIRDTKVGWGAFASELEVAPDLFRGSVIEHQLGYLDRRIEGDSELLDRSQSDLGFRDMYHLELIQAHAQRKALLVATGELDPKLVFELDSAKEQEEGGIYISVDWTSDWTEIAASLAKPPAESKEAGDQPQRRVIPWGFGA